MKPSYSIQPTFAGGEFSPALYSRVDIAKYSTGLKTARNVIIHPHGGVSNRPGTKYVAEVKDSTKFTRLVAFEFSTEQSYIIEFGNLYCRFYKDDGQILKTSFSAWNSGTAYVTGDFVSHNSKNWIALQNGTNKDPDDNPTYWKEQTIYEIVTPYLEADLPDLKFAQSADTLYIVHPDYAPRKLERLDHDSWTLSLFPFVNGPFMLTNTGTTTLAVSAVTGTSKTLTASAATFDALQIGGLFRIDHDIPGQSVIQDFNGGGSTSSIKVSGTWRIITHGTWNGTLKIEKSTDGGSTWTELRCFTSFNNFNVNTYGTDEEYCLIRATMATYIGVPAGTGAYNAATAYVIDNWCTYNGVDYRCVAVDSTGSCTGKTPDSSPAYWQAKTCRVELSSDPFTQKGIVKITAVASSTSATVDVLTEVGSTSATTDWAEGSWSALRGYPSSVIFYQDRLVFAGSVYEPQTLWFSMTGSYADFGRSDPLVDSDGISINLPSRKMNGIKNMIGLGEILAFTSATEWSIGPSSSGIITPTSIDTKVQGYRGSNGVTPLVIGNRVIFIQPMGSVLSDFVYDYTVNGYASGDLVIMANHLFDLYDINDMAYQQEPDSIVWCIRSDGIMPSMTYMKEQEVLAWTWHDTGEVLDVDGNQLSLDSFESIASIPGDGFNEIWLIVKRGTKRFVERMVQRLATLDPKDQFFVDCGISYDSPMTITGATAAKPVVITTSEHHGFSNGDLIDIQHVVGMTEINELRFKIKNKTDHTFELTDPATDADIDGTAYTAYISGGQARKAQTVITGLTHLEGKTVAILADGSVLPQQVVASGQITITPAAGIVHVGLPYTSDIETLNIELQTNEGTIQGRKIRAVSAILRFLNSRGGWIGPEEEYIDEIAQRMTEYLDNPINLFSGDIEENLGANYDTGGRIFFRQLDPLPFTILAVIPKVVIGGM